MVSYVTPLQILDHYGIKQVLGGKIKDPTNARHRSNAPTDIQTESYMSHGYQDANFYYEYDNRGNFKRKYEKSIIEKYAWHQKYNIQWNGNIRITPLTEFEKQLGIKTSIPVFVYKNKRYSRKEFLIYEQTLSEEEYAHRHSSLHYEYKSDTPKGLGKSWELYFRDHAEDMDLITVNIANLQFEKKHPYCIANNIHGTNCNLESTPELPQPVIDKIPTPARPNPKEVEKVEPVEIEPIKEVVKYSPLMIAGVIAVVVILLLKRRRA